MFAPLLDGLAGSPGFTGDNVLNVFTPGLLVMMALFGAAFVGFGLIEDLRSGVVERLRVTPASRLSLLLDMVLRDILALLTQSTILVAAAIGMGFRPNLAGLLLCFGLLGLIGFVLAPISYAIALFVRDEGALAASLNTVVVPLMLLSGILLSLSLAPQAIRTIAQFNPFAHAVNTARALIAGNLFDSEVLIGFGFLAALAIVSVWWAVRAFREAIA